MHALKLFSSVEYTTRYTDRVKLNFVNKTNLVHRFFLVYLLMK